MIFANIALLLLSAAGLSSASHCGNNSMTNSSCLHVGLYDMFQEGWDGARHYLERPDGSVVSRAPTCDDSPVLFDVCPDEGTGLYYMVVQHEDEGYTPFHYWEILWKVQVETDCNGTEGILRTGGFNTTMVWHYEEDGDAWTLVYWKNLWENTKECDACGDAKKCKPKKKHKKKKKPKHKKSKKGTSDDTTGSETDSSTGTNTTGTGTTTTGTNTTGSWTTDSQDTTNTKSETHHGHHLIKKGKHDKSKSHGKHGKGHRHLAIPPEFDDYPRYGPPAVNVKVTMWDEEGDGWWRNDYMGSSWYISDSTRTELFHTGTLCDGFSGECKLCLGDGSYVFRATGNRTSFEAWQFCGVRGTYHSELSFHIKKGKCYPDALVDIIDICEDNVTSSVTLEGVIAVSGVASEFFSSAEAQVIATVLSTEVTGWDATNIKVVDAALDARALSGRSLATYTHEFAFQVTFTSESAFGVDGKNYEAVNDLIETIQESLEDTASSGQFAADLASVASSAGVSVLRDVRAVELVSLELSNIAYSGAKTMVIYEESVEDEDYLSSGHQSRDYTAMAVFMSALGVALVAFVGVVAHRSKGYNKLEQESTHVKEVMPAEMDSTISPLSGNFAARESPVASAL